MSRWRLHHRLYLRRRATWRRKITDRGVPLDPGGNSYEVAGTHLDLNAKSICDALQVGADQQSIRDLLAQRHLSFHEEPAGSRVWLVEESNSQCKLCFDDNCHLLKKRKAIVTENGSWSMSEKEKQTQAPTEVQASANPQQPSTAETASKSPAKPKKVFTNDDIKSSPFAPFGGLFYFNTGSINDCDAGCFDQVRISAQVNPDKNPNWRHDVLEQIEFVRSDSEWQGYLHQLYDAHNKVCQLNFDKQDELARAGGTRNLGPQQIAITEKYEQQLKPAQVGLADLVASQFLVQRKFADKPFANAFAKLQGPRMQSGYCSQARVIYAQ